MNTMADDDSEDSTDFEVLKGLGPPTEPGQLDAFISYARRAGDTEFVDKLCSDLERRGKSAWVDRSNIEPAAQWRARIARGIEAAKSFIFVLSPESAGSDECARELTAAIEQNKRIIPLLLRNVADSEVPPAIKELNWIYARQGEKDPVELGVPPFGGDDYEKALNEVVDALESDLEWRDMHTRLATRTREWRDSKRDRSLLLRGSDLRAAEVWYAEKGKHKEQPTDEQYTYITESRRGASHRQRWLLSGVSAALVVALVLAGVSLVQRNHAISEAHIALSGELAAESTSVVTNNAELGSLLSAEAYEVSPTASAEGALIQAIARPLRAMLRGYVSSVGSAAVDSVAFSPDGKTLAAADLSTAQLWNVAKRSRIGPALGDDHLSLSQMESPSPASVVSVAFSPDDKTLATGDNFGEVVLWDTATRSEIGKHVNTGSAEVTSVAFSPNGKILAAGDYAGNVVLWDVATDSRIGRPLSVGSQVNAIAFSPDGKTLVTGDGDGEIVLWDTATHSKMGHPLVDGLSVYTLTFSPDGKTLGAADRGGNVELWDVANGSEIVQDLPSDGTAVVSLAFSPNGKTLAGAEDSGSVLLWDVATHLEIGFPLNDGSIPLSVSFSPDGKTLAEGDISGNIALWNTANLSLSDGDGSSIDGIAYSPDGKTLAAGDGNGNLLLWNTTTRSQIGRDLSDGDGSSILCVAFSPDGKIVATGDADGNVTLWNTVTRSEIGQPLSDGDGSGVDSIAFSQNTKTFAAGDTAGNIVQWVTATRSKFGQPFNDNDNFPVSSLAFSGTTLVEGDGNGKVASWDLLPETALDTTYSDGDSIPVNSVAFSPNGKTLAAGSGNGNVTLWESATGSEIGQALSDGDGSNILSVAFNQNGKTLAAGDSDGNVVLWDTATRLNNSKLPLGTSGVNGIAFSPNGKTLAAADSAGDVVLLPSLYWTDHYGAIVEDLCQEVRGNLTRAQWSQYLPGQPYKKVCPAYA